MLAKTTCLHIPPLYEEGTARILWESSDDADGYELDVHYDEDFETASTGKTWSDIKNAELSAAEIEALDLTWKQIAKLPAQGLRWRNIEFYNPTWEQIKASNMTWQDIQRLPVEFTVYRGTGEKTQGPDQGLVWANIDGSGLSWFEIAGLGLNWEDFMFRPSIGINWSQIQSENLSWVGIEAIGRTWHDFERQAARGLGWGSLDGRFLAWQEIEGRDLTWKQFENLPPDSNTHIAHTVDIPIYKKKAIFRVRAYKDGEYSDYLTSSLISTLPRSLAKYKPPCLHIPELHEGKTADIVWGDLYGASGYVLERKLGNKEYAGVFNGSGKTVPHPSGCKKPDELYYTPDCKQHLSCTDQIPYYEKTVQYRIKGYNTTDSSQYLETVVVPIIPVFYRDDSVRASVISGGKYLVQLHAKEIEDFEAITMSLKYDPTALQLERFVLEKPIGKTDTGGNAYTGNVREVSYMSDLVRFQCIRQMRASKEWNGLIASVRFKALRTGSTDITLS